VERSCERRIEFGDYETIHHIDVTLAVTRRTSFPQRLEVKIACLDDV
jgi:hypothetical protein